MSSIKRRALMIALQATALILIPTLKASASSPPPITYEGRLVKSQECDSGLAIIGRPNWDDIADKEAVLCARMSPSVQISPGLKKLARVIMLAFPELTQAQATLEAMERQAFISVIGTLRGVEIVIESVDSRFE